MMLLGFAGLGIAYALGGRVPFQLARRMALADIPNGFVRAIVADCQTRKLWPPCLCPDFDLNP